MPHCYILYSKSLNRFYTGSSILNPPERLEMHLEKYYGESKFTAKTVDWQIFLIISCETIEQARRIEKHIKRMKSSRYIRNLITYPAILEKLKEQY
jgi:putative endonuclease